jgi:hypothetical protein
MKTSCSIIAVYTREKLVLINQYATTNTLECAGKSVCFFIENQEA